jgi:hypothetical protein
LPFHLLSGIVQLFLQGPHGLAGADPMGSIASRVAKYWALRFQAIFVATTNGIIKANVAANGGDFQNDVSGAAFADGVTNFSAEAFIDAAATMGDSSDDLSLMMTHSVVMARMKKNNLIDYIPDSEGRVMIPTFLGHEVIVDDGMPATGGVFDTWIFGAGAFQIALGLPKVPTETYRYPQAGNGGGRMRTLLQHGRATSVSGQKLRSTLTLSMMMRINMLVDAANITDASTGVISVSGDVSVAFVKLGG